MFKKLAIILVSMLVIAGVSPANAASVQNNGVAVVDVERVLAEYKKAQDIQADMKIQEAEFQKALADAQKKVKNTTSPVERKNLEEKLAKQLQTKAETVRNQQIKRLQEVETNISNAIDKVTVGKYSIVIKKDAVISGGTEITDQVLNILNSSSAPKATKKK